MASLPEILRGATARVLPPLFAVPLVARLVDTPPRSLAELASFAALGWVAVLARPLVVALGVTAALYAARARVSPTSLHSWAYAVRACVAVLLGQLIGSLFMQAAGPFVGVPVDLAIGAAAALLAYVARPSTRGPAPAAT